MPPKDKGCRQRCSKTLGPTLSKGPTTKACSSRTGVCNEQEGSCHLCTVVTGTLFLNSKPFRILFDSGATYSFLPTRSVMPLNLDDKKTETNYRIKLPNDCVIECPISYKLVPITISGTTFPVDLIQFDLSDFDFILGMNWLHIYGVKIDCEDLKVILKDEKGREVFLYGQKEKKILFLNFYYETK